MAVAISEGRVPRRSCVNCDEAKRREYGCTEDTERQEHWLRMEGDVVIKRCPYALAGPREFRVIQSASLIDCGVLPDLGGWLDQAASFCEGALAALGIRGEFRKEKKA